MQVAIGALFVLFDGLAKVPRVWFEAELALRETVLLELLRNVFYSLTALLLARIGAGAWSMAFAYVGAHGLYAALLWIRARGRIPLWWAKGQTWALLRQSSPLAYVWSALNVRTPGVALVKRTFCTAPSERLVTKMTPSVAVSIA